MRLQAVARAFDKTECRDAYSGDLLFLGQFGLYDDTKRDSEAAERRILSLGPDVELPQRLVIYAADRSWIVGHGNPDTYRGKVIRVGYVVHEATALAKIYTLAQFAGNTTGVEAYAGRAWFKDLGFSEQSSNLAPQYHIHFARNEQVQPGYVIDFDGEFHIVRSYNRGAAGTLIAHAEQMLGTVVESANVSGTAYDPVTESWTGSLTGVRMIRMRWQSLFEYHNTVGPRFGPEDIQLAVAKTAMTPKAGMTVTLSDGVWKLASVQDEGAWLCRAVRHG